MFWPKCTDEELDGLQNDLTRAAQSGHHMDIHVLLIHQWFRPRCSPVPLRSKFSLVHDTLARLAQPGIRDMPTTDLVELISFEMHFDSTEIFGFHC